jgi:TPR repeat protein
MKNLILIFAFIGFAYNAFAQFSMDRHIEKGIDVITKKGDGARAEKHFLKSAEKGNPVGQYILAELYSDKDKNGIKGIKADKNKRRLWLIKAAEQNYAPAQEDLAAIYYKEGNLEKAFEYRKQAAENGYTLSQSNLPVMYAKGQGTKENREQAFYWCKKCADNSIADLQQNKFALTKFYVKQQIGDVKYCQYFTAIYLFEGRGVAKNVNLALDYLRKSAQREAGVNGETEALFLLGEIYRLGEYGVGKDLNEALKWYDKASLQDNKKAKIRTYQFDANTNSFVIPYINLRFKYNGKEYNHKIQDLMPSFSTIVTATSYDVTITDDNLPIKAFYLSLPSNAVGQYTLNKRKSGDNTAFFFLRKPLGQDRNLDGTLNITGNDGKKITGNFKGILPGENVQVEFDFLLFYLN